MLSQHKVVGVSAKKINPRAATGLVRRMSSVSEFSAVLVGRYGVGKTTLFKTIKAGKPPQAYDSTSEESGLDSLFYTRTVNERNIRVSEYTAIATGNV